MRACELGEVNVADACEVCEEDRYSLDLTDTLCTKCPDGATCPGGARIVPDPGYWRPDELYDGVFECPNEDACVGTPDGEDDSLTGECDTGYTGNMC